MEIDNMNININELTLSQIKEIQSLTNQSQQSDEGINFAIGKKVIIRTCSAGVFFGTLKEKVKNEVIITDARRLWRWHTKKSLSLSSVAKYGVEAKECKFAPSVNSIWLQAIEIIPCSDAAIASIEEVVDYDNS